MKYKYLCYTTAALVSWHPLIFKCFAPLLPRHSLSGGAVTRARCHRVAVVGSTHDGTQFNSSLLSHNQQDDLSAAVPMLLASFFLTWLVKPKLLLSDQTEFAINPLDPTSTGKHHVFQPDLSHSFFRSSYLVLFLSNATSILSSHGTVSFNYNCLCRSWPHYYVRS